MEKTSSGAAVLGSCSCKNWYGAFVFILANPYLLMLSKSCLNQFFQNSIQGEKSGD